jgi:triosephosphate isomerase
LQELNVEVVEIGHSERRQMFRETDVEENKKVLSALSHGLIPLLCVGETAEEKRLGIEDGRLRDQLKIGLQNAREQDCANLWIAYEPVWAIGAEGIPADADYANQKHRVIRDTLRELFPREGDKAIILYGGSVNPDNAGSLISQPAIDGLFIGRAAWEAAMFNSLVRKILPLWRKKRNGERNRVVSS